MRKSAKRRRYKMPNTRATLLKKKEKKRKNPIFLNEFSETRKGKKKK